MEKLCVVYKSTVPTPTIHFHFLSCYCLYIFLNDFFLQYVEVFTIEDRLIGEKSHSCYECVELLTECYSRAMAWTWLLNHNIFQWMTLMSSVVGISID